MHLTSMLSVIGSASLLAASPAWSQDWPIKEFEVVAVEPAGHFEFNSNYADMVATIRRAMRDAGFDPDLPGIMETVKLDPRPCSEYKSARCKIQEILALTATELERMGFWPPRLEPVVTGDDGVERIRVYLVTGREDYAGVYHANPCEEFLREDIVILLDADDILDPAAPVLTFKGVQTVAHELFHAVQGGSPFFQGCDNNYPGDWITEGTARAFGYYMAGKYDPAAYYARTQDEGRFTVWGRRNYSKTLPVPTLEPTLDDAYLTASLWKFLAEVDASGIMTAASIGTHPQDFTYLRRMFSSSPAQRDCVGLGASCRAEVGWLEGQVRTIFRKPLWEVYSRFMQAYAMWGATVSPKIWPDMEWLGTSIKDGGGDTNWCQTIELSPGADTVSDFTFFGRFEPVSARCFRVALGDFQHNPVLVAIDAELKVANDKLKLDHLTGVMSQGSLLMDRARLEPRLEGDLQRVTWHYPFPNKWETVFLLTNVADIARDTTFLPDLTVRFTALEEYAFMGNSAGSGPTPSEIDTPLPIHLDDLRGKYLYPAGGGLQQHIDNGYEQPCILRFNLNSSYFDDGVSLAMDHDGPIRPGDYPVAWPDGKDASPWLFPDAFIVRFGLGEENPAAQGDAQSYVADGGTVTLDHVSKNLIQGRLVATGRRQWQGEWEEDGWRKYPDELRQLAIEAEFSLIPEVPPAAERYLSMSECISSEPLPGKSSPPADPTPAPGEDDPTPDPAPDPTTDPSGVPESDPPSGPGDAAGGQPPADATQQAGDTAASGGPLPDGEFRQYLVIRASGAESAQVTFVDDDLQFTGGCTGASPVSLSLFHGHGQSDDWVNLSFETTGNVATGQTGTFDLGRIDWDFGTTTPANLPPESGVKVPNRYGGSGSMNVSEHVGTIDERRMAGRIAASLARRNRGTVSLEAEFSIPWSCGVR